MPKHQVFLFHGMGDAVRGTWDGEWVSALTAASEKYAEFASRPLSKWVDFVPITYDDLIGAWLKKWSDNSATLDGRLSSLGSGVEAIFTYIRTASKEDRDLFWSHVVDVVLWWLFPIERADVQSRVLKQVVSALDRGKAKPGAHQASVIAHSLGTAVAHNTLHELATSESTRGAYGPGHHRWDNLFLLANVSRVVQTSPKAYESVVRPGPQGDESSCCRLYYSARHVLDPITWVKTFSPVGWPPAYRPITIQQVSQWNVHAFEHYVRDPRVHVPMLRALTDWWMITEEEERQETDRFDSEAGLAGLALSDLRDLLPDNPETQGVLETVQFFLQALKTLRRGTT